MKFIAIKIVKFTSVMDALAYKEKKNNHSIFLKLYFPKYLNNVFFLKEINIIFKKKARSSCFLNKNNAIVFQSDIFVNLDQMLSI